MKVTPALFALTLFCGWVTAQNQTGRYESNNTRPYKVDALPDFDFDLGELYSGLMPVDHKNDSRALFFVFQPTIGDPVDEVTIYLNGGPGSSSLQAFFSENGRFLWWPGTIAPVENMYSWVNLTNMLWVEYPVSVGFSRGELLNNTEESIAQDFIQFFKNFQDTFGITHYKIYVSGESYAGKYVPYIGSAMIDANDTAYYDLQGILLYDPCIGEFNYVQNEAVAYGLATQNSAIFNFNDTFMAHLESIYDSCGYKKYIDTYLVYPPSGQQPPTFFNTSDPATSDCDIYDLIETSEASLNPCWSPYDITASCPIPYDPIGWYGLVSYLPRQIYFNRTDVKAAIHAPQDVNWMMVGPNPFGNDPVGPQGEGDISPDAIQGVLPKVIEHTNKALISNGDLDMSIITNGTLLAIQNMTWNGQMGFQSQPNASFVVDLPELQYFDAYVAAGLLNGDGPQGVMGVKHYERGLMWCETFQSGHEQPQYQPRATYKHLQWLLGRIEDL